VPYLRKLEPKQEVQGFEDDGEAAAEQDGADQPKPGGEPEPMVEQPEGGVALSAPELPRQADGKQQGAKEKRREKPCLPFEVEQQRDDGDTGDPGDSSRSLGSALELHEQIDRDHPKKRRGKRSEDLVVFGLNMIACPQLVDRQEAGKQHAEGEARDSRAYVGKPASPGPASCCLCHGWSFCYAGGNRQVASRQSR
jgi:hypothetical protein